MRLSRRHFLAVLSAASAAATTRSGHAAPDGAPFHAEYVVDLARQMATAPFQPTPDVPSDWIALTYDQYRDIRFKPKRAVWGGAGRMFELQFLPPGYGFRRPAEIWIVTGGVARKESFKIEDFELGPLAPSPLSTDGLGFSGFRGHAPLNRPDHMDEAFVFHGASYFRAVARGQNYGLSARGLAIDTLKPGEEEFPDFQKFWVETPEKTAPTLRVHALLNSRSTTGAFRFDITPGETTVFDVDATIFPRREIVELGLAPLTSMFLFGPADHGGVDDYRPAAHDSDGLLMVTGLGQRLWRPLINPHSGVQVSAFSDTNPVGFGLSQRAREWRDYADLALHYEKRPSAWIEPKGDWGAGHVMLVEIPAPREEVDNVVAYWRPAAPLSPGEAYRYAYRITWCARPVFSDSRAPVVTTRTGPHQEGGRLFVIDFGPLEVDPATLAPNIWASAGEVHFPVIQANPHIGGVRLFFGLRPGGAKSSELGASLTLEGSPVTETWLYRWIA